MTGDARTTGAAVGTAPNPNDRKSDMIVLRVLGYLLLLSGIAVLGAEVLQSLEAGSWTSISAGELWTWRFDRVWINNLQVGLERYIHPFLWDPIMLNVLLAPAWLVLGLPGLLLVLIARRRRNRRMFT